MSVLRYRSSGGGWMPIDALLGSSGTTVTVDGVEQTTWDADTKLDTGKSMEYTANGTLRVHQMTGGANGSPTGTYQEMRGDAFYTRSEAYQQSAQYAPTNVLLAHLSNGQTTSYEMGQIKYKPDADSPYYSNKLPQSDGTLVNDSILNSVLNSRLAEMLSTTVPNLISNSITSNGQWIGGGSHVIRPKLRNASKGYIVMLKSDTDTQVKFTAERFGGESLTLFGKAIILFVAKAPAPGSYDYFSTWAISVDNWGNADAEVAIAWGESISLSNQGQPCQEFIFEY